MTGQNKRLQEIFEDLGRVAGLAAVGAVFAPMHETRIRHILFELHDVAIETSNKLVVYLETEANPPVGLQSKKESENAKY